MEDEKLVGTLRLIAMSIRGGEDRLGVVPCVTAAADRIESLEQRVKVLEKAACAVLAMDTDAPHDSPGMEDAFCKLRAALTDKGGE